MLYKYSDLEILGVSSVQSKVSLFIWPRSSEKHNFIFNELFIPN